MPNVSPKNEVRGKVAIVTDAARHRGQEFGFRELSHGRAVVTLP